MGPLLITGIPATGKTCFGDYLANEQGYVHLDFEAQGVLPLDRLARMLAVYPDLVATWGFVPDTASIEHVLAIRSELGFRWVWFGGDREAAHRAYLACERPEENWVRQLDLIKANLDPRLEELGAEVIDVFDTGGSHRPHEAIWAELCGQS